MGCSVIFILPRCAVVDIKEGSVRPPKLDHPPLIETLFPINNQVLEKHFFSQGISHRLFQTPGPDPTPPPLHEQATCSLYMWDPNPITSTPVFE
jgi:hypothetical protein